MPLSIVQKEKFKQFLQNNAYGKPAEDGGCFNERYTEVQTFSELEFVEIDGALEADITQTYSYHLFYSPGTNNYSITEADLVKLAETLGIQFDPKTNFHGKLIITDPRSIQILREAGVIKEKDMSSQASAITSSAPSLMKVDAAPASSATFFSPSTGSGSLEQLAKECEELNQLEEREQQLKIAIERKRKEIAIKTQQLKAEPRNIDFQEKIQLAPEHKELLDAFYTLRELINAKFYVKARGEWSPLSPNAVMVKLDYAHQVPKEMREASRFLHAIGGSFKINHGTFGNFTHTLNLLQCEAAIKALSLLSNKSPESIEQIESRPVMRC
jgi:hypothetical protein